MFMIDILLATYNSSEYIREQIDSIIEQDCHDWRLLIRDGGSSDRTRDILEEYRLRFPDRIDIIATETHAFSVENFSALMETSTAPYVMFCDHDDVWLNDKVGKTYRKMIEAEKIYGSDKPVLIFTDMAVVNCDLEQVSGSYFAYQNLDPEKIKLNNLLVQNIPSGCTMLLNRPLVDLAGKIPDAAVMHDHWIALTACTLGKIEFLDEATLLYRQHSGNVFGAAKFGPGYISCKLKDGKRKLKECMFQALAFLSACASILSDDQIEMLQGFASINTSSSLSAVRNLVKFRIFKNGMLRNLGMLYALLQFSQER